MQTTMLTPKSIDKGFIVIYNDGPMAGCNAVPGASIFPTQAHAEIAIYVMGRVDLFDFQEAYEAAITVH